LDNVVGYLKDGFTEWRNSGKLTESIPIISAEDAYTQIKTNVIHIIDVREPHEYGEEWIPSSLGSPLTRLEEEASCLDVTTRPVTACPSGHRSTTAASIMKRKDFNDVAVLKGGLNSWKEEGYPMEQ